MSWAYIGWVWKKEDLPAREKWLLFALAYHANDEDAGMCWPKVATLMRDTRLSARTIQRALDELEQLHLVYRWETVAHGEPTSNTYLLNIYDMGPQEWRRHYQAEARRVKRGWVHRRNVDRQGDGHKAERGETPPLFGGVADKKLRTGGEMSRRAVDSLTPPDGQGGRTGRRAVRRGRQSDRTGGQDDGQNR